MKINGLKRGEVLREGSTNMTSKTKERTKTCSQRRASHSGQGCFVMGSTAFRTGVFCHGFYCIQDRGVLSWVLLQSGQGCYVMGSTAYRTGVFCHGFYCNQDRGSTAIRTGVLRHGFYCNQDRGVTSWVLLQSGQGCYVMGSTAFRTGVFCHGFYCNQDKGVSSWVLLRTGQGCFVTGSTALCAITAQTPEHILRPCQVPGGR